MIHNSTGEYTNQRSATLVKAKLRVNMAVVSAMTITIVFLRFFSSSTIASPVPLTNAPELPIITTMPTLTATTTSKLMTLMKMASTVKTETTTMQPTTDHLTDTTMVTATPTTTVPPTTMPHFEQRILTKLEEKLESLSCDLLPLPTESRLWQGNETQELLLPVTLPADCDDTGENEEGDCEPAISWEGAAEMQSGDVLLVRIDDARLKQMAGKIQNPRPMSEAQRRQPETAVYQVTRPGHAHCDVTEGVLLDITPLVVDGKKIVTLYDKDLTEGVNLLIVVSEAWGGQCVRLRVVVKSDSCGDNQGCSSKGVCFSNISMEGYECQCCPGFVGPHCEERDACYVNPCQNNGICVDISQGHDGHVFQCLCPYGFTGKTCSVETNPCDSSPCQNGGTCAWNATTKQFRCECTKSFAGPLCQHSQMCDSSPCVHGICVNDDDGFRCFCQPGFAGQQCQYEYNECESSPCINGGTCMDHIDGYTCICGRGYTAKRCHIKIDLCDPNPCRAHHYCIDRGNNYSCECPKGYAGPNCLMPSRAACSVNPCRNGGTCWSSVDSFYCACRPGYTGKTCQDEFVLEPIPSAYPNDQETKVEMQVPISIHLDHLHNLYIAAGTLACAFIIVMFTVAACHCRVHETYKRCFNKGGTQCKTNRMEEGLSPSSSRLCPPAEKEKNQPGRCLPARDTSDMYYTLDFSDSQSSPLIQ